MQWLLDTNVVSETTRSRPNQDVLDWIAERDPGEAVISTVTLAELHEGAASATDPERRARLTAWLNTAVPSWLGEHVLPLTLRILIEWLRLSKALQAKRQTRAAADLLIASTARVHDLILVTRNTRDFADTGVVIYDPWTGKTHRMEQP